MRGLIAALFASKLRMALVGFLIIGIAIGGAVAIGALGVPAVADMQNTFGEVTDETTTIETDLVISNPNPIGIGSQDVSVNYTISMNSIEMAHGDRDGVAIGSGNSTLDLETQLQNDAIPPWWVSHIENDEHTVIEVSATVASDRLGRSTDLTRTHAIETDLIGAFNSDETRPVNAESPLTDDPVLYINETSGAWGTVSDEETPIDMSFLVYNPNLEPYAITELGYEITMNDIHMGDGETHREYVIPSRSTETIDLTTTLNNQNLDEWWVSHLDETVHDHQVSDLRIEFYAVVELPSGSEVTVPLDELTYEETLETDIFDEGLEADETDDPNDGGTDSDDADDEADENGEGPTDDDESNGSDDADDEEGDEGDGDDGGEDEDEDEDDDDDQDDDDGTLPL